MATARVGAATLCLHELSGMGPSRTGGKTWDAAFVLAEWLEQHVHRVRRRRVLELGSGTGLVGLSAAALGADVTLTDVHPEVLQLHAKNIETNQASVAAAGGSVRSLRLEWGEAADATDALRYGPFDVLLGSDILYFPRVYPLLVQTLCDLGCGDTRGATAVLAFPMRPGEEQFAAAASAANLAVREVACRKGSAGRMVGIIEVGGDGS